MAYPESLYAEFDYGGSFTKEEAWQFGPMIFAVLFLAPLLLSIFAGVTINVLFGEQHQFCPAVGALPGSSLLSATQSSPSTTTCKTISGLYPGYLVLHRRPDRHIVYKEFIETKP